MDIWNRYQFWQLPARGLVDRKCRMEVLFAVLDVLLGDSDHCPSLPLTKSAAFVQSCYL